MAENVGMLDPFFMLTTVADGSAIVVACFAYTAATID